jgi:putative hydrolase of HD superfamily
VAVPVEMREASAMKTNETLIDLLLEVQALDRVPRLGYLLRGIADPESIAEHSWQVSFLVMILAQRIDGIDRQRALELSLIHDLAELRVGDLPRTASRYLPSGAKRQAEAEAMAEILAPLPERYLELFDEYQRGESVEARLVKACDKLQLMLKVELYESWGAGGLAEFWENPDNFPDGGFGEIAELFAALRERRSERLGVRGPEA